MCSTEHQVWHFKKQENILKLENRNGAAPTAPFNMMSYAAASAFSMS